MIDFFKSNRDSYFKGIVFSTFFNFLAKGIVFFNSFLILRLFGINAETDAYFLVVSSLALISTFFIGASNYVIIPESMKIRTQNGAEDEKRFINFYIYFFAIISIILALVIAFIPIHFYQLFAKYTPENFIKGYRFYWISAFIYPLLILTNFISNVLTSHKFFTVPMLVSIINGLFGVTLLFVFRDHSPEVALWGLILGYIINLIWLLYMMMNKLNWNFFMFDIPSKTNLKNLFLIEINIIPVTLGTYLAVYLLSGFKMGVITSYNYGQLIGLVPETLIIAQIVNVLTIKFNELSAQLNYDKIDALYRETLNIIFLFFLPLGLTIFILSDEIVQVLNLVMNKPELQSGSLIGYFLGCFAIIIPFRAFSSLTSVLFTSLQKIKEGVIFAIVYQSILALFLFLCIHFFSIKGFLINNLIAQFIIVPIFFYFYIRKITPFVQFGAWIKKAALFVGLLSLLSFGIVQLKLNFPIPSIYLNIALYSLVMLIATWLINRSIHLVDIHSLISDKLKKNS